MLLPQFLLLCGCPPSTAIADIPLDTCIERLAQIQKIVVQRTKTGEVINTIPIADAPVLATWTALKSAVDSVRVQATPFIQEPVNEPGEAREYGGGNATLGGIPINVGRQPSTFDGVFIDAKQVIIKALKGYECEKDLSIYMINEHGNIIGLTDDHTTPTILKGIPIKQLFISDKKMGMFEEPDKNMVKWSFLPNWSDMLHVITPTDFDALSQL
jgi:hypothetical protein